VSGLQNLKTIADSLVAGNKFTFPGRIDVRDGIEIANVSNSKYAIIGGCGEGCAGRDTLEIHRYDNNGNWTHNPLVIEGGNTRLNGNLTVNGTLNATNLTTNKDLVVKGNATFEGDLFIQGQNKWRIHTPDDTRRSIYFAPMNDNNEPQWGNGLELTNTGNLLLAGKKPILTRVFTLTMVQDFDTGISAVEYPAISIGGLAGIFDVEENGNGNFSFARTYKQNDKWFIYHNYAAQNNTRGNPLKIRCNFYHRTIVEDQAGMATLNV
jgi:hypothetical protein